jgi:hypothetical protein
MVDMNEEETVKLFVKNGFQLSKNALRPATKDPKMIVSELKKIRPRPFIITEQHIKNVLTVSPNEATNEKKIKKHSAKKTSFRVDDYVKDLHSYYEKNKSLLLKKHSLKKLISVNKITPRTIIFSVIGLVRKKNEDSILIEDPTGEIKLYFEKNMEPVLKNILLDNVIGVKCKKINEKFYAKKVFPLDNKT